MQVFLKKKLRFKWLTWLDLINLVNLIRQIKKITMIVNKWRKN
jgi:hypothetical protein